MTSNMTAENRLRHYKQTRLPDKRLFTMESWDSKLLHGHGGYHVTLYICVGEQHFKPLGTAYAASHEEALNKAIDQWVSE